MVKRELKKAKQAATGLLIVLSLFVSSSAACICSHHAEKVETKAASCHEHSKAEPETSPVEKTEKTAKTANFDSGDDCGCRQTAPRIFSKSKTIKIEKQASALTFSLAEFKIAAAVVSVKSVYFEKPFYLSDSFYNIKSPRAPPVA